MLANVRAVFVKFDRFEFNLGFEKLLQVGHQTAIRLGHKTDCQARSASAAGATNPVNVVFGVKRDVEVEHGWHVLDIEPACGHIGTHQQIDFTFLERVQRLEPFVLALVAVQGGGFEPFALQRAGQARAAQFAVHEYKRLLHAALAQHLVQGMALVIVADTVEVLLHGGGGGVRTRHFDRHWVLQVTVGQTPDFGREGCGEQQCGALLGQETQDTLQIRQKTDIQHAVRFVEHHVLDLVEYRVLGFDMVQQTPRRGDQYFDTALEFQRLRLHVHAAKHHRAAQLRMFGVGRDRLRNLDRQLARGQQHQRPNRVAGRGCRGVLMGQHPL